MGEQHELGIFNAAGELQFSERNDGIMDILLFCCSVTVRDPLSYHVAGVVEFDQ